MRSQIGGTRNLLHRCSKKVHVQCCVPILIRALSLESACRPRSLDFSRLAFFIGGAFTQVAALCIIIAPEMTFPTFGPLVKLRHFRSGCAEASQRVAHALQYV